jgi:pyrroline-5-carboxylate reductase
MEKNLYIGFIGAGNMGGGLISGLVRSQRIPAQHLTAVDLSPAVLEPLNALGVQTSDQLKSAITDKDLVVIALKPQIAAPILKQLGDHLADGQILVSIMAGISTERIESHLGKPVPVVRVMPQMAAAIGDGASGVCGGKHVSDQQLQTVCQILDYVGSAVVVPEQQMDAVTGLSGSGPAYVYTIIEALTDGGVRMGLGRDVALKLAAQTLIGSARMVLASNDHPAVLRDRITSPGGTTIAALHKLEEKGLRDALISAVQAATQRSVELGKTDGPSQTGDT